MPNISTGFQTSTSETILFVIVLAVIVVGLLGYQVINARRHATGKKKRRPNPHAQPVLKHRTRTRRDLIQLGRMDQRTLDHLSWFLKDPHQQDRLIEDDHLLLRVARQGIREGIVSEVEVMRLLRKLEIDTAPLRAGGRSSETIPGGAEVSISDKNLNVASGHLLLSGENGLRVRLDKGHRSMHAGTTVEVVCGGDDGLYRFHSAVIERSGKEVTLQHSRHVEHVQRRKYRRREVELPVEIRLPGIEERPLSSRTEDLSIGGAAIRNPKKRVITGARVELTLDAGGAAPIEVAGTAVRTSRRDKTVHISFSQLNEETRHRLFRRLIRIGGGQH